MNKKTKKVLTEFESAVSAYAWIGSADVEDRPAIADTYAEKRAALIDILEGFDPDIGVALPNELCTINVRGMIIPLEEINWFGAGDTRRLSYPYMLRYGVENTEIALTGGEYLMLLRACEKWNKIDPSVCRKALLAAAFNTTTDDTEEL